MHGNELHLFGAKAFPPTHTINAAYDITAVGTTFKSLAMTQFGPNIEPITFPTPIRYVLCHERGLLTLLVERGYCASLQDC